jgi:hypothetical protein
MSELTRSHGRFFKKLLSDPARAREYLHLCLPVAANFCQLEACGSKLEA